MTDTVIDNPMCMVSLTGSKVAPWSGTMRLEVACNWLLTHKPTEGPQHTQLCRETVVGGGQYETNVAGMVFKVRKHDVCSVRK